MSSANAKPNTSTTSATTSTTNRLMKLSGLHEHQMLNEAHVDEEALDTKVASENVDVQGQ